MEDDIIDVASMYISLRQAKIANIGAKAYGGLFEKA